MNAIAEFPGSPAFDRETISRLRSLAQDTDPALFAEILCTFRDDMAKYMISVRQAFMQRDAVAVKHCAHAIKGASMNTGALCLAGISERMEDAAAAGNLFMVAALISGLEGEIQRVLAHIGLELSAAAA